MRAVIVTPVPIPPPNRRRHNGGMVRLSALRLIILAITLAVGDESLAATMGLRRAVTTVINIGTLDP